MTRLVLLFLFLATSYTSVAQEPDPAEITIGERLFSDFRFSQFFYEKSQGDANHALKNGDPQLEYLKMFENKSSHLSPFRGQAMSCASCHMVDQANDISGMRLYADFANFSPVPLRASDPNTSFSLRNTQIILPLSPNDPNTPIFFHWDGEFSSLESLAVASLSGRNMGWVVDEQANALENVANIIRNDNGQGSTANEFGGYSYRELFLSEDPLIPQELRLPKELRLDIAASSSEQIVAHTARLIAIFMQNISLQTDASGHFSGSPYDVFLRKNNLPLAPNSNETAKAYAQRLLQLVESNQNLQYVTEADGAFVSHNQPFQFGEKELIGLRLFFRTPQAGRHGPAAACVQCHTPPNFTDSGFHNIGLSQLQYESVHGADSFKKLQVPTLSKRESQRSLYALPTADHPERLALLRSQPESTDLRKADLGVWTLFANPDFEHLQVKLKKAIALSLPEYPIEQMSDEEILSLTLGMTKTPSLRNLGHSAPYFHDGHANTLEEVLSTYISFAMGSRHGTVGPVDPKISNIHMHEPHAEFVIAFLKSLNEDYE